MPYIPTISSPGHAFHLRGDQRRNRATQGLGMRLIFPPISEHVFNVFSRALFVDAYVDSQNKVIRYLPCYLRQVGLKRSKNSNIITTLLDGNDDKDPVMAFQNIPQFS